MIDLRSDTVTQPCAGMRAAMLEAPLGDDVYGDDPTVNLLEATLAERAGKASGLFLASGTQSNLCALLSHCGRGDEYIAGQDAHTYKYEAGGGAVLGGIQPQPIPWNARGELDLQDIQRVIKPDDIHFAKTRLLCLENTVGGKAVSQAYTEAATGLARSNGLLCHLDGARIFNAAEKLNLKLIEICQPFDSISFVYQKDWARRPALYWLAMRTSSNVPVDGEKCLAAACAKRASSPRRACTPSRIMWRV